MKILIVSDAGAPQINGVVRAAESTVAELIKSGDEVRLVTPSEHSRPCPTYPEIRLERHALRRLSPIIDEFKPQCVHIMTEGPLGWAARNLCLRQGVRFTTSYHTKFPEFIGARVPYGFKRAAIGATYALLRHFHAPSGAVMVATETLERELSAHGFRNLVRWPLGVDTELFKPYGKSVQAYERLPHPVLLYVGRVSVEKNIPAFLALETSGSLVVVGGGPDLERLRKKHPHVHFLGALKGEELALHYAAADMLVFPSKTDTLGLVILEALASGLPVAAYPVPGPADIFAAGGSEACAVLDNNLQNAVDRALPLIGKPDAPRAYAMNFSWQRCTAVFRGHLIPSP